MKEGWAQTGVILLSENGKESCFIDRSAVRWIGEAEWWTIMHPPCTSEPIKLAWVPDLPNA